MESRNCPPFEALHGENLTFIYDDGEEEVISGASFDVEKGEIVALTGISGIGKSTLLKILLGIYAPVSGRLYASCGEKQIDIGPATRRWFSYVPQGNMLMSGSIYEAVDFLHTAPYTREQRERVERACQIACADEFIRELPNGYQTVLGEKGAGLSEGQMQRLAIARAVYRNAPVLLLDEVTSALDEDTEHRLLKNLKALGSQTVLIVTHRPAAMEICSKRLVFQQSHITVEANGDTAPAQLGGAK
ncbi:MAG: ATP-binding cassette domain-containing protein [Oscillospiraceae bacterium]|nr:ATP-binding cassette domain-containing protein [Oscillospiraceae bacterium]